MKLRSLLYPLLLAPLIFSATPAFARTTPNDIYQQDRSQFNAGLARITDPTKRQKVVDADATIKTINQDVCIGFDTEVNKMAAILDEEKARQKVTATRVAYGQGDTPLDTAEYYLNYAEEAVAYQKIQDYTPSLSGSSYGVSESLDNLLGSLSVLQGKLLKAKTEINTALNYYEK